MTRDPDFDQLLRGWLDEGESTPPERYVWAALERIDTTRQRGALAVSLEDFIMRAQPFAAAAAVAIIAILGLAVYIALAGGPNVGDPDTTPTQAPGAFQTERFGTPLSAVAPEEWTVIEDGRSIALVAPNDEASGGERISVIDTDGAMFVVGSGGASTGWPDDLAEFLDDFPLEEAARDDFTLDLTVDSVREATIAGASAQILEVTTFLELPELAGQSTTILSASVGTDVVVFAGEGQARFVEFPDRNIAVIYIAAGDRFSEARFQAFLDSLQFADE